MEQLSFDGLSPQGKQDASLVLWQGKEPNAYDSPSVSFCLLQLQRFLKTKFNIRIRRDAAPYSGKHRVSLERRRRCTVSSVGRVGQIFHLLADTDDLGCLFGS